MSDIAVWRATEPDSPISLSVFQIWATSCGDTAYPSGGTGDVW